MSTTPNHDPLVTFTPQIGRFILAELWAALLGVCVAAILLGLFQTIDKPWLAVAGGAALFGVLLGAALSGRSRRITIGDKWISYGSTTIQFDTMDRASSGIRDNRIQIISIGGRDIKAKTAWYAPEDVRGDRTPHSRSVRSGLTSPRGLALETWGSEER